MRATSTARRGCSAPTSSSPAPTISCRLRRARDLDRRHERLRAAERAAPTCACAGTWATSTLHSITGFENVDALSRGDIDGGYGASFLPPGSSGPGVIPFASESADGMPKHKQWTQEFRLESDRQRPVELAGRAVLLPRGLQDRELQLRLAGGQRAGRLPARTPEEQRGGAVRRGQLRRQPATEAARRSALHARTRRRSTSRTTTTAASCPAC